MDNADILRFLQEIDTQLAEEVGEGETLDLYLIGRSALILGYGQALMTKDVDVVYDHGSPLLTKALLSFGKETVGSSRHGFYLEAVPPGLPPIPMGYQRRCTPVPGPWKVIRPSRPEVHDLIVTKLKRFHPRDREDIRILCDLGGVTPGGLEQAIESASMFAADEDEDPGRRAAYANLRRVIEYLEGRRREL